MQLPKPSKRASGRPEVRAILDDIRRIVRALRVYSRAAEKRVGLSGAQLFVLQKLAQGGQALSVNELAELTLTHQSSVSVVVQRLVERGLVERRRAPSDARRAELALTPAGRRVLGKAPGAAQDRLIQALQALPSGSRRELAELLGRVVRDAGITDPIPSLFFEDRDQGARKTPRKKGPR